MSSMKELREEAAKSQREKVRRFADGGSIPNWAKEGAGGFAQGAENSIRDVARGAATLLGYPSAPQEDQIQKAGEAIGKMVPPLGQRAVDDEGGE